MNNLEYIIKRGLMVFLAFFTILAFPNAGAVHDQHDDLVKLQKINEYIHSCYEDSFPDWKYCEKYKNYGSLESDEFKRIIFTGGTFHEVYVNKCLIEENRVDNEFYCEELEKQIQKDLAEKIEVFSSISFETFQAFWLNIRYISLVSNPVFVVTANIESSENFDQTLSLPQNFNSFSKEEKIVVLKNLIIQIEQRIRDLIEKRNKTMLTKNTELEGGTIYTTESGMTVEVVTLGTGPKPIETDTVEVHYHGTTEDGKVFDSSIDRGEKMSFRLQQVIQAWAEGIQYMPVGSKFILTIPANLAYGESSGICVPKTFLETAQWQSIPKEAFTGKKCVTQDENGEEAEGEYLLNPQAHPLEGKTLIFEVELFDIKEA